MKLWEIVRDAVRGLRADPAISTGVVLILGVALTGVATLVAFVQALFMTAPPGLSSPETLVAIYAATASYPDTPGKFSWADYLDVREGQQALSQVVASARLDLALTTAELTERVTAAAVSSDYFQTLGVQPAAGQFFSGAAPSDHRDGPVAVLEYGAWRRWFQGDPELIGESIQLNGNSLTVIGIAPAGFRGPGGDRTTVWLPLDLYDQFATGIYSTFAGKLDRHQRWLDLFGRIAQGGSLEEAQVAVEVVDQRIDAEHPNHGLVFKIRPLLEVIAKAHGRESLKRYLSFLGVGLVLVLLAVCFNVCGLLLGRALRRQHDLGVRLCLGQSRAALAATLLAESVLLGLCGGGLGVLLVVIHRGFLKSLSLPIVVVDLELALKPWTLLVTVVVTLICTLGFGGWPAWQVSRSDPFALLAGSGPPKVRRFRLSARELLTLLQISVCFLVVVAAGLTQTTLFALRSIEPGFEPERVLRASVDVASRGWPPSRVTSFYDDLVARLTRLPGVESVSLASGLMLAGSALLAQMSFELEGSETPPSDMPNAAHSLIGAEYFRTIGCKILRGRDFDQRDTSSSPGVLLINEAAAREFWRDRDPLGQRVLLHQTSEPFEVVGVVADARLQHLSGSPSPIFFLYRGQAEKSFLGGVMAPAMALLLRTQDDPRALLPAVRAVVRELDAQVPIYDVATLDELAGNLIADRRQAALLFTLFAALATVLSLVGLSAALAQVVSEKTREVGVRVACGATPREIRSLILRRTLALTLSGIAIGLIAGRPASRWIESQLYGVQGDNILAWMIPAVLLLSAALLTATVPARHAATIDPVRALRWN